MVDAPRLVCLADDLTGAADVAVQFYNKGVTPTTICLQQRSSDPIELSTSVTSSQHTVCLVPFH